MRSPWEEVDAAACDARAELARDAGRFVDLAEPAAGRAAALGPARFGCAEVRDADLVGFAPPRFDALRLDDALVFFFAMMPRTPVDASSQV